MAPIKGTDAVLRARAGTTRRATVARILRTWDAATPATVAAGAAWYPDARNECASLALGTRYPLETVINVVAQLSPRTPWTRNMAGAVFLLTAELPSEGRMPGILLANFERAYYTLQKGIPLRGPKVRAFAANISGDVDAVTIDVWAARVALGANTADPLDLILDRAGVYAALADCYRAAARARGVDPRVMQSTCWIQARNGRAS